MSAFLLAWVDGAGEPDAGAAVALLNLAGVRRLRQAIGVWPDLDGPELRGALAAAGDAFHGWPVIRLDSPAAAGYQDRDRRCPVRVAGEGFDAWRRRALAMRRAGGGSES